MYKAATNHVGQVLAIEHSSEPEDVLQYLDEIADEGGGRVITLSPGEVEEIDWTALSEMDKLHFA